MEKQSAWVWKNGEFLPFGEAKTHIMCQGLHYGAAIFEGIRLYSTARGSAVFRLEDHINRFFYSGKALGMNIPFSGIEIMDAIAELIRRNNMRDGYIRPIAWYAAETLGVAPRKGARVDVAILAFSWKKKKEEALSVKISPIMRIHPASTDVEAKLAGTYNNSLFALLDAERDGYDDAILLDYRGNVAEASSSNVFAVLGGEMIITPPRGAILPGITRSTVLTILRECDYEVHETGLMTNCFAFAKEIFLCGTALEIMPVAGVNGEPIGDGRIGRVTDVLCKIYRAVVHGEISEHLQWLTFV